MASHPSDRTVINVDSFEDERATNPVPGRRQQSWEQSSMSSTPLATKLRISGPEDIQDDTTIYHRESPEPCQDDKASSFRVQDFADKEYLSGWFPRILDNEAKSWRIWLSRRSRSLMAQITLITTILAINVGLTIFAFSKYRTEKGVGLIYQGSCDVVKSLDQWLHLLINILSTGLLSASNYCMQLQGAPTRKNIDDAHRKGKSLDIGVPSLRNLRYIGTWRRICWGLLALSSLPVHLIYNSAVFQSLSSNSYTVAVVKDSFLTGAPWSLSTAEANRRGDPSWDEDRVNPKSWNHSEIIRSMQRRASTGDFERLDVSDCFELYNRYWKPQGDCVVLVSNETAQTPADDSLLMYVSVAPRWDDWAKNMWALSNATGSFTAKTGDSPIPLTHWYLGPPRYRVSHCLVQPPREIRTECRFQYSLPIMVAICSMNLVKGLLMLGIWIRSRYLESLTRARTKKGGRGSRGGSSCSCSHTSDRKDEVLYTLGDAIASFMRDPDDKTKGMCLATKDDFTTKRSWYGRRKEQEDTSPHPRIFKREPRRWASAASPCKWLVLFSSCLLIIIVACVLLVLSTISLARRSFTISIPELFRRFGFGRLTPYTFMVIDGFPLSDPTGLIINVLIANLPQLILSVLFLAYNTVLSTFLVQREFSLMSSPTYRKTLRVSEPEGIQRSSFFISLPLRYGVPLYLASGVMHWVVSQSLFLARVASIRSDGTEDPATSFSTCGYSPVAILTAILAGVFLLVVIAALGVLRRYDGTMRMVSVNSRAIAAACHVLEEDQVDGYLLPLQWGLVSIKGGRRRCAFTTARTGTIEELKEGVEYGGDEPESDQRL